jgi:hypothetical protein
MLGRWLEDIRDFEKIYAIIEGSNRRKRLVSRTGGRSSEADCKAWRREIVKQRGVSRESWPSITLLRLLKY